MSTLLHYTFPRTQDRRIYEDVRRQLTWQSDIQSEEIRVEVREAKVFLSGPVETCCEKIEAERAANAVYGVADVVNNIVVAPKHARTDSEINDDIVAALRTCTSVVEEIPEVHVNEGVAILRGRSRWEFQRQGAERVALAIVGVKSVVNQIVVDPDSSRLNGLQKTIRFYRPSSLASLRAS